MADRRLPFTLKDDDISHQGEVLIVRAWRPEIELSTSAAFTIVLAQRPPASHGPQPHAPNVVLCAPARAVRLPAAIAEPAAGYDAGGTAAPPVRLSPQALASYAAGALLATQPLSITAQEVFGQDRPRFDLLARQLLAAGQRNEAYWRTLDEVLSWPRPPGRVVRAERLRSRLAAALGRLPSPVLVPSAEQPIMRLRQIAMNAQPEQVVASPGELGEDVAFIRCLAERPEDARQLAGMRAYLDGARTSPRLRALLVDHAVAREQLSFTVLLSQPDDLARMRGAFELFQAAYAPAYTEHHRRYWRAFSRLRHGLEEAAPTRQALAGLNTLRALGRPVGLAALAAHARLTQGPRTCQAKGVSASLRERPTCSHCPLTMADAAPTEEVEEVLRRLHGALARQQARLAGQTVRRILARGGERVAQFLQIVQAADLAGLSQVLDEELLAFLRDLLSQPFAPTQDALDLFNELARVHPTVSEAQVDAVIETLRELLTDKLASQQAGDPSQPAALRLAAPLPGSTS